MYNVSPYIVECLDSVKEQAYKGPIECIIVDDCSTDDSLQIVKDFVSNYSGIIEFKIIERELNCGISAVRNVGLEMAKGDYVYFLDSDDYLTKDSIDSVVSTLESYRNVDLVYSEYSIIEEGKIVEEFHLNKDLSYINGNDLHSMDMYRDGNIVVSAWNKLVRREWLIVNNLFFDEGRWGEDVMWTFRTICVKPSVAYNHSTSYIYRRRKGSIMRNLQEKAKYMKMVDSLALNYIDMVKIYIEDNVDCQSLINHIFWCKAELLRMVIKNGVTYMELKDLFMKFNSAKLFPLMSMPRKYCLLEMAHRIAPRILTLILLISFKHKWLNKVMG